MAVVKAIFLSLLTESTAADGELLTDFKYMSHTTKTLEMNRVFLKGIQTESRDTNSGELLVWILHQKISLHFQNIDFHILYLAAFAVVSYQEDISSASLHVLVLLCKFQCNIITHFFRILLFTMNEYRKISAQQHHWHFVRIKI